MWSLMCMVFSTGSSDAGRLCYAAVFVHSKRLSSIIYLFFPYVLIFFACQDNTRIEAWIWEERISRSTNEHHNIYPLHVMAVTCAWIEYPKKGPPLPRRLNKHTPNRCIVNILKWFGWSVSAVCIPPDMLRIWSNCIVALNRLTFPNTCAVCHRIFFS